MKNAMTRLGWYRLHGTFVVANAIFAAVFVTLLLSAFHQPSPHDVPVGIVGPDATVTKVRAALDDHVPGGFDVTSYTSSAAAQDAVKHHDVDGALVLASGHPAIYTAAAGGSAVNQTVQTAFETVTGKLGQQPRVVDLVPADKDDSQGLSPFFAILGVLFPSLAAGAGSAILFRHSHKLWCLAAPVLVAALSGLIVSAIADAFTGFEHYFALAGIAALFSLAVSAPTAAFGRIKPPLVALGIVLFMVIGLPVSGGPSGLAPFGSGFLRIFDNVLPLGDAVNATRNTIYFDGHNTGAHLWVLAAWALLGLAALALLVHYGPRIPILAGNANTGLPDGRRVDELAEIVPLEAAGFEGVIVPDRPSRANKTTTAAHPAPQPEPSEAHGDGATQLVVGFDNSDSARRALEWSIAFLSSQPGELTIVYVDHPDDAAPGLETHTGRTKKARNRSAIEVATAVAKLAAPGTLTWSFAHRHGYLPEALSAVADEQHAARKPRGPRSIIVVGRSTNHGRHMAGTLHGDIVQRATRPVLVIP